ncbi:ATP-dependent DNA ligase [Streptomyces phaeochromogenes]
MQTGGAPGNLPAHAASLGCVVGFLAVRVPESTNLLASAFDVLRLAGTDALAWPYRRRRAALEGLFAEHKLTAPWALCPSTTDPDTAREWLTWSVVGLEGLVLKPLDAPYRPTRGWQKYKVLETQEAIVGAITGPLTAPLSLLLGRLDAAGHLQYTGRTTGLPQTDGHAVAELLAPPGRGHPWRGWPFSAGWSTSQTLKVTLVRPELVVEVQVDVARDSAGRWRHPARLHRARPDLQPTDVPRLPSLH